MLAVGRPFCVWTDASKTFTLYLAPGVIRRLGMECSIAFEKVPRRGLEIGGILLGRTETEGNATTVWVDGFRAVESEHRSGPSYLLSESDLVRLQEEIGRCGGGCVGIFRSQTRTKQLTADTADTRVFEQCFPGGAALFLMVAPALSRGAFFGRQDGDLKCVHELALPQTLPSGIARAVRTPRDFHPERSRIRALPPIPTSPVETTGRFFSSKWRGWYAAALIAMLALGASVNGLADLVHRQASRRESASKVIELKVQPAGSLLRVMWDPNSVGLRRAAQVVLHVQDGDYRSDRELAASELRTGSITYQPRSDEVLFRMDAYPAPPIAAGSVRVINSTRRTSPNLKTQAKVAARIPQNRVAGTMWLGMSLLPVTREVALAHHLAQPSGLLVASVDARSPAGASGLESGDILLALDAQRIKDTQELQLKIGELSHVRTATLAIFRGGEIRQVEVNIGGAPGRVAQSAAVAVRR